ncbi:hypothetical protein SAMN04490201_3240 [Pseudomonas psychrophila]|uniref:Uncharacterized protein n=1 Tax=Pseudomonas psychrophila TaxID=122355 RepID=A0ABY0VXX1_9PSED|nr:hypothetical protein SAMN04490201_3240 [Pseudomonas psychrophila]
MYLSALTMGYVHWTARRLNNDQLACRWVDVAVRSGHGGGGQSLDVNVRQLLAARRVPATAARC